MDEGKLEGELEVKAGDTSTLPTIESAGLYLYQLYDVGYSIDLDMARELLAAPSTRVRPVLSRGASIDVPELPLEMSVGERTVVMGDLELHAHIYARIYDLGILALRVELALPRELPWEQATTLIAASQSYPEPVREVFEQSRTLLHKRLDAAIERPSETVRTEDYAILVIAELGPGEPAAQLAGHPALLQVALGERRPLSRAAASLATTLSYYEDDLILLTWSAAVVVEPSIEAREDATFLLEFANVQLLAFRSYDDEVARDLQLIMPRINARRRLRLLVLVRPSARFLHEIHTLIADSTRTSARMENALTVTEDVYWNRVYSAAITVLRVNVWRNGIAESLAVLRETAGLLHDEAQTAWASLLELLVIVLILVELIVSVFNLR